MSSVKRSARPPDLTRGAGRKGSFFKLKEYSDSGQRSHLLMQQHKETELRGSTTANPRSSQPLEQSHLDVYCVASEPDCGRQGALVQPGDVKPSNEVAEDSPEAQARHTARSAESKERQARGKALGSKGRGSSSSASPNRTSQRRHRSGDPVAVDAEASLEQDLLQISQTLQQLRVQKPQFGEEDAEFAASARHAQAQKGVYRPEKYADRPLKADGKFSRLEDASFDLEHEAERRNTSAHLLEISHDTAGTSHRSGKRGKSKAGSPKKHASAERGTLRMPEATHADLHQLTDRQLGRSKSRFPSTSETDGAGKNVNPHSICGVPSETTKLSELKAMWSKRPPLPKQIAEKAEAVRESSQAPSSILLCREAATQTDASPQQLKREQNVRSGNLEQLPQLQEERISAAAWKAGASSKRRSSLAGSERSDCVSDSASTERLAEKWSQTGGGDSETHGKIKAHRREAGPQSANVEMRRAKRDARHPHVSAELEAMVAKHAPQELHLLKPRKQPKRGPQLADLLDSGSSSSSSEDASQAAFSALRAKPSKIPKSPPKRSSSQKEAQATQQSPLPESRIPDILKKTRSRRQLPLQAPEQADQEAAVRDWEEESVDARSRKVGGQPLGATEHASCSSRGGIYSAEALSQSNRETAAASQSNAPSESRMSKHSSRAKSGSQKLGSRRNSGDFAQRRRSGELQSQEAQAHAEEGEAASKAASKAKRKGPKAVRQPSFEELTGWHFAAAEGRASDVSSVSGTTDNDHRRSSKTSITSKASGRTESRRSSSLYEKPWRENMRSNPQAAHSSILEELEKPSSPSKPSKISSPDQHLKVLEFMQRKRTEIAERIRQESEAVRAPVIRRLEARRTAASIEQEQARARREERKAKRAEKRRKSAAEQEPAHSDLSSHPISPSPTFRDNEQSSELLSAHAAAAGEAPSRVKAPEPICSVVFTFGRGGLRVAERMGMTDKHSRAQRSSESGASLQGASLKRKMPIGVPSSFKQPRANTSPSPSKERAPELSEDALSPGKHPSGKGGEQLKAVRQYRSPLRTRRSPRGLQTGMSKSRDFSLKVPPLRLNSGELQLPGLPEAALQAQEGRQAKFDQPSTALQVSSARTTRGRLWRMDSREVHQARVNAMMSQVLDLQDRIAALAVTASPRQRLLGSPAAAGLSLPDLRLPRLMTTRSLPCSIEAALSQMDLVSSRSARGQCLLSDKSFAESQQQQSLPQPDSEQICHPPAPDPGVTADQLPAALSEEYVPEEKSESLVQPEVLQVQPTIRLNEKCSPELDSKRQSIEPSRAQSNQLRADNGARSKSVQLEASRSFHDSQQSPPEASILEHQQDSSQLAAENRPIQNQEAAFARPEGNECQELSPRRSQSEDQPTLLHQLSSSSSQMGQLVLPMTEFAAEDSCSSDGSVSAQESRWTGVQHVSEVEAPKASGVHSEALLSSDRGAPTSSQNFAAEQPSAVSISADAVPESSEPQAQDPAREHAASLSGQIPVSEQHGSRKEAASAEPLPQHERSNANIACESTALIGVESKWCIPHSPSADSDAELGFRGGQQSIQSAEESSLAQPESGRNPTSWVGQEERTPKPKPVLPPLQLDTPALCFWEEKLLEATPDVSSAKRKQRPEADQDCWRRADSLFRLSNPLWEQSPSPKGGQVCVSEATHRFKQQRLSGGFSQRIEREESPRDEKAEQLVDELIDESKPVLQTTEAVICAPKPAAASSEPGPAITEAAPTIEDAGQKADVQHLAVSNMPEDDDYEESSLAYQDLHSVTVPTKEGTAAEQTASDVQDHDRSLSQDRDVSAEGRDEEEGSPRLSAAYEEAIHEEELEPGEDKDAHSEDSPTPATKDAKAELENQPTALTADHQGTESLSANTAADQGQVVDLESPLDGSADSTDAAVEDETFADGSPIPKAESRVQSEESGHVQEDFEPESKQLATENEATLSVALHEEGADGFQSLAHNLDAFLEEPELLQTPTTKKLEAESPADSPENGQLASEEHEAELSLDHDKDEDMQNAVEPPSVDYAESALTADKIEPELLPSKLIEVERQLAPRDDLAAAMSSPNALPEEGVQIIEATSQRTDFPVYDSPQLELEESAESADQPEESIPNHANDQDFVPADLPKASAFPPPTLEARTEEGNILLPAPSSNQLPTEVETIHSQTASLSFSGPSESSSDALPDEFEQHTIELPDESGFDEPLAVSSPISTRKAEQASDGSETAVQADFAFPSSANHKRQGSTPRGISGAGKAGVAVPEVADRMAGQILEQNLSEALDDMLGRFSGTAEGDRLRPSAMQSKVGAGLSKKELDSSDISQAKAGNAALWNMHAHAETKEEPPPLADGANSAVLDTSGLTATEESAVPVSEVQELQTDMPYICAYIDKTISIFFRNGEWDLQPDVQDPISLEEYVAMERAGAEASDAQHIFNKAVFDSVNEALLLLLSVECSAAATGAQRRIQRERAGSERWKRAVREEVKRTVCVWSAPRENDDFAALLLEDIPQDEVSFQNTSVYEREIQDELAEGVWKQLAEETEGVMSSRHLARRMNLSGILASESRQESQHTASDL